MPAGTHWAATKRTTSFPAKRWSSPGRSPGPVSANRPCSSCTESTPCSRARPDRETYRWTYTGSRRHAGRQTQCRYTRPSPRPRTGALRASTRVRRNIAQRPEPARCPLAAAHSDSRRHCTGPSRRPEASRPFRTALLHHSLPPAPACGLAAAPTPAKLSQSLSASANDASFCLLFFFYFFFPPSLTWHSHTHTR